MSNQAEAKILPIPSDFPVVWDDPEDETLFWFFDRMHTADPLSPVDDILWHMVYDGVNHTHETFGIPTRMRVKLINTYLYITQVPLVSDELLELGFDQQFEWNLRWDAERRRYQVLAVRHDDNAVYERR